MKCRSGADNPRKSEATTILTPGEVVLGLLHQLTLRAHAVEHLQEHGAQQFLGRDAGPPA